MSLLCQVLNRVWGTVPPDSLVTCHSSTFDLSYSEPWLDDLSRWQRRSLQAIGRPCHLILLRLGLGRLGPTLRIVKVFSKRITLCVILLNCWLRIWGPLHSRRTFPNACRSAVRKGLGPCGQHLFTIFALLPSRST